MQTRFEVFRATLFSTAMAGAFTLGASAPAMADVFAFGQTGASGQYASFGSLEVGTASGTTNISTNGNQGWLTPQLNSGQTHSAGVNGSTNYLAGGCGTNNGCQRAQDHDNFFVFNLSKIKGPVTTATLAVAAGKIVIDGTSGSARYNIYDLGTNVDVATKNTNSLLASPTNPDAPLYTALTHTGALIGQIKFTASDTGGVFDIALNDLGLRDLNYDITHGITNFAIGGSVDPAAAGLTDPSPPPDPPPSAPSPLPGVGVLQSLGLLGFLAFAAARARFRA